MEKAKLAKCPLLIYVFSQPCINPYHFPGYLDLIYASLNNFLKESLLQNFRFYTADCENEKVKTIGKHILVGFFPKVPCSCSMWDLKMSNLIFISSTKLSTLSAFFFLSAIMHIVTWANFLFERFRRMLRDGLIWVVDTFTINVCWKSKLKERLDSDQNKICNTRTIWRKILIGEGRYSFLPWIVLPILSS